ncbi:MAG: site-2 protease family protein [Candidatus Micrarchaeota archaeon]
MLLLLLAVLIGAAVFYGILQLEIPGLWQFVLVVIEMATLSQFMVKRYGFQSEMGLVLLKSTRGVDIIESLAKNERLLNVIADIGAAMSYGLLSFALMRKNASPATAAIGLVLLAVILVFAAPVAFALLLQSIRGGEMGGSVSAVSDNPDIGFWAIAAVVLIGGLFLFILMGIIFYGIVVFRALVLSVFFGTPDIGNTAAGGTFLIPGVNLPLVEGIFALAIVMIVHEGAHAILARVARVPILSSGIVLFGILPVGAFVEPDEKKLASVDGKRQTRVLVAGPTANLITALLFFLAFMGFFYTTAGFREEGLLVTSGLESVSEGQTVIYAIAGERIDPASIDIANFSGFNLPKNSEVELLTNKGAVLRETDANGKMGITFTVLRKDSLFAVYSVPFLGFIYTILGLSIALNFVVGAVNILPIPLFDGYRIIDVNIKNKTIVKALSYTALFFFILNFLPHLF